MTGSIILADRPLECGSSVPAWTSSSVRSQLPKLLHSFRPVWDWPFEPIKHWKATQPLGRLSTVFRHTFSAFWLRSSVVSVLISLISGTCYMVTNEINCIVWATSMGQALGLLALQDRGPGLALSPGAARCFGAITNPTFFYLPTTFSDRFLLLFWFFFFVRIECSKTVTTSAELSKCASNRG